MTILNDRQIGQLCEPANFLLERSGQTDAFMREYMWFPANYTMQMVAEHLIGKGKISWYPKLSQRDWDKCNMEGRLEIGCWQSSNTKPFFEQTLTRLDVRDQLDKPLITPYASHQVKEKHYLSNTPFEDDPDYAEEMKKIEAERNDIIGGEMRSYRKTEKIISYGQSSFGYDLRLGRKFKIFTNVNNSIVDPKRFDDKSFVDFEGDVCIIPPNSFVLASSLEKINMPRNLTGVVLGKSTYARCGISTLATPLEGGWSGHVTLEFANTTPLPAMLYAGEGCCQVLFYEGEQPLVSYADRGGKYMNQPDEPVAPRI